MSTEIRTGPLTGEQVALLMEPLQSFRVANRSQGGRQLSYVEAWDIKAMLIRVFGFGNFSAETIEAKVLRMAQDVPAMTGSGPSRTQRTDPVTGQPLFNWSVTAQCTVRLSIHTTGAVYTETAAASQVGPDVGEVTDFAIKTAESDALKRAATYLGTQFGLSLYRNGQREDVVQVLMDPQQKRALDQHMEATREQREQAQAQTQARLDAATTGATP